MSTSCPAPICSPGTPAGWMCAVTTTSATTSTRPPPWKSGSSASPTPLPRAWPPTRLPTWRWAASSPPAWIPALWSTRWPRARPMSRASRWAIPRSSTPSCPTRRSSRRRSVCPTSPTWWTPTSFLRPTGSSSGIWTSRCPTPPRCRSISWPKTPASMSRWSSPARAPTSCSAATPCTARPSTLWTTRKRSPRRCAKPPGPSPPNCRSSRASISWCGAPCSPGSGICGPTTCSPRRRSGTVI